MDTHLAPPPRRTGAPLIAITGQVVPGRLLGLPAGFADAPIDSCPADYARAVADAGGLPLYVPLGLDVDLVADRIDGLLLSGGADVDPVRYGGVVGERSGVIEPDRDDFEIALLDAVRQRGKPVLGICRGAQLINVALGGTLVADLPIGVGDSHASYAYPRARARHLVELTPGSLAFDVYGPTVMVNSFHHQAVAEPAPGIAVSGHALDGVAECVETADRAVLGVQWHPECLADDPAFDWLVGACRETPEPTRAVAVGGSAVLSGGPG